MRKLIVVLLCMLALFAVVSCNNEPKTATDDTGSDETVWDAGTLLIKPGEGCVWGGNSDRFQFYINVGQALADGDEISFLVKLSDSFEKIVPRSSNSASSWAKFQTISLSSLDQDDDDWYIVSVTATEACDYLGITCMLKSDAVPSEDLYVGIMDLKINDLFVDFDSIEGDAAMPFSGAANPDKITAVIVE